MFYLLLLTSQRRDYLKFEVEGNELTYTNSSSEDVIRHRMYLSDFVVEELKRMVDESEIMDERDKNWPMPDDTETKLEIEFGSGRKTKYVKLTTHKLVSIAKIMETKDPEGLKNFFHLTSDLRVFFMNLITIMYKVKPL